MTPEREHELAVAFEAYTDPISPQYDSEFDAEIRRLRSDWFPMPILCEGGNCKNELNGGEFGAGIPEQIGGYWYCGQCADDMAEDDSRRSDPCQDEDEDDLEDDDA
jgi:hypothetical protein